MSHRGQDTLRHVTNSPDPIVTRRRTSSPQGETLNGVDLTSPPQGETLNGAVLTSPPQGETLNGTDLASPPQGETLNGADLTSPPQGGNPEKKLDYLFLYNSKTDFLWQIQINYSTAG